MEIPPPPAAASPIEDIRIDRRTDMTRLIEGFSDHVSVPEKQW